MGFHLSEQRKIPRRYVAHIPFSVSNLRANYREKMPRPDSDLPSCVTPLPAPPPPPPPPAMGFPTPTAPLAPLQMLCGDGERVESSDDDGDDEDDEDEFEDSEPTEATGTVTEADSDGGLSATRRLQYYDQVTRVRVCQWIKGALRQVIRVSRDLAPNCLRGTGPRAIRSRSDHGDSNFEPRGARRL